jgi:hypothetical protein
MSEDQLQQKIVIGFKNNYQIKGKGLIFSVPNGGSRNILEAKKLKQTGSLAGVSDLIVLLNQKCLFIELKIEKGIQSEVQKQFEKKVADLGFKYYLVRSENEFLNIINKEL